MPEGADNQATGIFSRLSELLAIIYMAVHTGIQVRYILGGSAAVDRSMELLVHSAALAFFVVLFYYSASRTRGRPTFWITTMTIAVAIKLMSSFIVFFAGLPIVEGIRRAWMSSALTIARPVTTIYLWSFFLYSLIMSSGLLRGSNLVDGHRSLVPDERKGLELIPLNVNWLSTVLTAFLVALLPLMVVLSAVGYVQWDVIGWLYGFMDSYKAPVNLLLFLGFIWFYRLSDLPVLKYLSLVFAMSALSGGIRMILISKGIWHLLKSLSMMRVLSGISSLLLVPEIYFWLRAVQTAGRGETAD